MKLFVHKISCNIFANKISDKLKNNKKQIIWCLAVTFIFGLAAHAYMFFNTLISYDSLNEFIGSNNWKIQLGRVFVPAYRMLLRGNIAVPWLVGLLSLFYIGVTVFLVTKIFDIKSKTLTFLIAGIFATNITVIATAATFIHDLDADMMALLLAAFAVFLWKSYGKGFLYGMIPICLSIGLYQSYISVAITLILLYLIMQLLNGVCFSDIFKKGCKSIAMLVGGGILYFLSTKVICGITGIELVSGSYNSVDTVLSMSIPQIILETVRGYKNTVLKILRMQSIHPEKVIAVINLVMIIISGIIILCKIFSKEIKIKEKISILILIFLLPIGMNVVFPLTGGMSNDLMHYAIWLVYLFVLLIAWWAVKQNDLLKRPIIRLGQRFAIVALVLVILGGNIQLSNSAYVKKDLEKQANLSLFTRVVYQMENTEGYTTGETPVVFVGKPDTLLDKAPGFGRAYKVHGSGKEYVLGTAERFYYCTYFDYILLNPAIMAEPEIWKQMQTNETVNAMPYFPQEGSVAIVDNVLVVKLGE